MNISHQKTPESDPDISFEAAFARLEEILERMNSGSISLDESLKLYEEADILINVCNKKLCDAERKVEILMKNRNNELTLTPDQRPITQDFNLSPNAQSAKQPSKDLF